MVWLTYTADGELVLPSPDALYCPGDRKGTRKVREYLLRLREEMIAEHERRERLRAEGSTEPKEET